MLAGSAPAGAEMQQDQFVGLAGHFDRLGDVGLPFDSFLGRSDLGGDQKGKQSGDQECLGNSVHGNGRWKNQQISGRKQRFIIYIGWFGSNPGGILGIIQANWAGGDAKAGRLGGIKKQGNLVVFITSYG